MCGEVPARSPFEEGLATPLAGWAVSPSGSASAAQSTLPKATLSWAAHSRWGVLIKARALWPQAGHCVGHRGLTYTFESFYCSLWGFGPVSFNVFPKCPPRTVLHFHSR